MFPASRAIGSVVFSALPRQAKGAGVVHVWAATGSPQPQMHTSGATTLHSPSSSSSPSERRCKPKNHPPYPHHHSLPPPSFLSTVGGNPSWLLGASAGRVGGPSNGFTLRQWNGHVGRRHAVTITFRPADGEPPISTQAQVGESLMDVAISNGVDIEGACGGQCACSTCHLILDKKDYDKLPEIDDDELDMLDLAMDVTETSRLGCQVTITKDMDGMEVSLPEGIKNYFN